MRFTPFILAAMLAVAGSAQAVQISPLVAVYPASIERGTLTITSTESETKTYQLFVDAWTVENGKAVRKRAADTDFRLVPSVMTIAPGKRQTVRFERKVPVTGEVAYRLRLIEVLPPEVLAKPGLHQVLNIDWPWFWRAGTVEPQLSARWSGLQLVVTNTGNASAQLSQLTAGSTKVEGLLGYVLPGETRAFGLGAKAAVPSVSVVVNGKAQTLSVQ